MLHGRLTGNKVVNWDIKVGAAPARAGCATDLSSEECFSPNCSDAARVFNVCVAGYD